MKRLLFPSSRTDIDRLGSLLRRRPYSRQSPEAATRKRTNACGLHSTFSLRAKRAFNGGASGTVIYEKNSHEILRPASITKIMTLILIFDAMESGQIAPADTVTVSEYAAGMGGSQVFLEPGETQTVDTMIKCISVASAQRRLRGDGGAYRRLGSGICAPHERARQRAWHE